MNFAAIGLGTIPQWGTAAIALGALITGWISIGAQREIARKRAALDFFAKTEMDKDLLSAHTNYTQAVATMQTFLHGAEDLAHFIEAYSEQYWAIRSYLNLHELMSVGIKRDVLDDHVCYDFWSGELLLCYSDTRALIVLIEAQPTETGTYCELVRMAERWGKRAT